MRLIAFPQRDKLTSLLRGMARQSAADYAQRNIVRIIPKNGVAHLVRAEKANVFFIHGANVNEQGARAWASEMFKRMWQDDQTP